MLPFVIVFVGVALFFAVWSLNTYISLCKSCNYVIYNKLIALIDISVTRVCLKVANSESGLVVEIIYCMIKN